MKLNERYAKVTMMTDHHLQSSVFKCLEKTENLERTLLLAMTRYCFKHCY